METPVLELGLPETESALLEGIEFDASRLDTPERVSLNGERALSLAVSLVLRHAIPEHRWRWWSDPEYNVGGLGASRREVLERRGIVGAEILRHVEFLPTLRYFIRGPDLPPATIRAFGERIGSCILVTATDVMPLGRFARQLADSAGIGRCRAADEFFKLALEYGLGAGRALAIRKQLTSE